MSAALSDKQAVEVNALHRLDIALCNFINAYGDPYDPPEEYEAETKRNIKELSDAYNAAHSVGVFKERSALVDVSAVEPEPFGYVYEHTVRNVALGGAHREFRFFKQRRSIFDDDANEFEIVETAVYTSPPLSREGEDAKAEQYWSTVEQLANCEDEISRLRALLSRAEEYVIDGVTTAKGEAEMNAPYPARAPRYDAALAEVRQLYADIQAALAATRSGSATTQTGGGHA